MACLEALPIPCFTHTWEEVVEVEGVEPHTTYLPHTREPLSPLGTCETHLFSLLCLTHTHTLPGNCGQLLVVVVVVIVVGAFYAFTHTCTSHHTHPHHTPHMHTHPHILTSSLTTHPHLTKPLFSPLSSLDKTFGGRQAAVGTHTYAHFVPTPVVSSCFLFTPLSHCLTFYAHFACFTLLFFSHLHAHHTAYYSLFSLLSLHCTCTVTHTTCLLSTTSYC